MTGPERLAVVFPGQGSQDGGMRRLVERRRPDLLEQLEAAVGARSFERLSEGTALVQPALFCANLAAWDELHEEHGLWPAVFAGHSLGDLCALVAARWLTAPDGLALVIERARLTALQARRHDGGMLAVLGGDGDAVARLAADHGVSLASDNATSQAVLAGSRARLEAARVAARQLGLRAVVLPVEGAFHSPQMAAAVAPYAALLQHVTFTRALVPVLSSSTASAYRDPARELPAALVHPVRWREVVLELRRRGVTRVVEAGPGRVLTRLVRSELPEIPVQCTEEAVSAA